MPTYPLLWYTSNTPITVGQRNCAMERFLGYHAGTHGTGYRKIATAVPLATGAGVHQGLELLGRWILEWQEKHVGRRLLTVGDGSVPVSWEVIAWAASEAADRYETKARAKGLELTKTDVDAAAATEQLIIEQRTLIEALVWVYALGRLPTLLASHRLLGVEIEETPVLDCTCGLGDWVGSSSQHASRGCQGIVAQGRADYLWERVIDSVVVYEEFKTKAMPNYGWEQSFEDSGQLLLNMEAASKRMGKDVGEAIVTVLFKGKRDRTNREDKFSPKLQQSSLVYGWCDRGGLNRAPEWAARYKWWDDYGKGHTLPRTFTRTGVWTGVPLGADNPNGVVQRDQASPVEAWVRGWILPAQYPELIKTLGPFPKPQTMVPLAVAAILAEERGWRDNVAYLRANGAMEPRHPLVGETIPRSWNCWKFDGTACMFRPVCKQDPGWEWMATMGRYEVRTPHHQPEKEAFVAAGVVFPAEEDDDGGDE